MPKKMLILRGTTGYLPDENGKLHNYKKGALHEPAAKEYARRKGYEGVVLDVSGNHGPGKTRETSPQTLLAVDEFYRDKAIAAFYGFSGGGYNVWWILHKKLTTEADFKRIELVVVIGAPIRDEAEYKASNFPGGNWDLVYKKNPQLGDPFVPRGVKDAHMFGPEWLLSETPDPNKKTP